MPHRSRPDLEVLRMVSWSLKGIRELILDPLELIIAVQKQILRGSKSDLIQMIRVVSQTFLCIP